MTETSFALCPTRQDRPPLVRHWRQSTRASTLGVIITDKSRMMDNEDDDTDVVASAIAKLGALGVDVTDSNEVNRLFENIRRTIQRQKRENRLLRGETLCTIQDVLRGDWQPYSAADYNSTVRDWNQFRMRIASINRRAPVLDVYQRTRDAASDEALVASDSTNTMSIARVSPVRLCSFPSSANFVDGARFCPKTSAPGRKTDTWIYVAASVLGMNRATDDDRDKLVKALCGSCEPGEDVRHLTGLNRSPFNLQLFASQDTWYDEQPGVLVSPVMTPAQARDWDGGSYQVLITCSGANSLVSAPEIARSIGLTFTVFDLVRHASACFGSRR